MKKKIKSGVKITVVFALIILLFPCVTCLLYHFVNPEFDIGKGGSRVENHYMGKDVMIEVSGLYKNIDVEEYVAGIMAGVISPEYNIEALKTQAVLVRTNVLKEMEEKKSNDDSDMSYEYLTKEDRETLWGRKKYDKYEVAIEKAVAETAGKVLRKEGSLIMAMYHEVSIGKTASASEILDEDISYLQSVDSSSDVEAKNYMNIYEFSYEDIRRLQEEYIENVNSTNPKDIEAAEMVDEKKDDEAGEDTVDEKKDDETGEDALDEKKDVKAGEDTVNEEKDTKIGEEVVNKEKEIEREDNDKKGGKNSEKLTGDKIVVEVTESTENGFVKTAAVGADTYSGEEVQEMLGLVSTNYYVENIEDGVRIVCLGKGNCLGVSQYGANHMADKGSSMEEIIAHYYKDVNIEDYKN